MLSLLFNINEFDRAVVLAVAKWRKKELTFILKMFTYSARGYAWFTYANILIILMYKKIQIIPGESLIMKAMICTFMTWIIGSIIKKSFRRKRPFQSMEKFPSLVFSPVNDSFPSLHAGATTAFFVALLLLHHPWSIWAGIWATIVIFSRLYLGVHYLSDLFGGVILGIFCGNLILLL
jgi:undecaprenyl-diphosphatase